MYRKDHRSNKKHSRHEVKAAVKRLKECNPQVMLNKEYLSAAVHVKSMSSDEDDEPQDYNKVYWAEDEDKEEDSDIFYLEEVDETRLKMSLSNK